jgi:predicted aspartyl protease
MNFVRFKSAAAILFGICFLFVGAVCAQQKAVPKKAEKGEAGEAKLTMNDLPKEVQATIRKETQGAEIVGLSKETEGGKTLYEVETKVNGRGRDMLIDAKGTLTEVEVEIDLGSLPAAVQAEIKRSIGKAKLVKLESVANGSKVLTGYSAVVETAGKQSEIEMGLDGKVLAKGK